MKIKLLAICFLGIIISLLMNSLHNTFLLAGGSDALDINVIPNPVSQAITLILFLSISVTIVIRKYKFEKKISPISIIALLVSILLVIVNGYTFTISGKKNAMVDKWYHLTLQTLPFNPDGSFESIHYKSTIFGISVIDGDSHIYILTAPNYLGVEKDTVIRMLENFGIKNTYKEIL